MNLKLEGKRALVTGGSKGIGNAIVDLLTDEGCIVSNWSRSFGVDVLNVSSLVKAVAGTRPPDILINNVGGGGRWGSDNVEHTTATVWGDVYQKNVNTATLLTTWAIPFMRERKWGRVVTITSILGGKEGNGRPWFVMAKAAQTALMKSLSQQRYLVDDGITFNSVAPGEIDVGKPASSPDVRMGKPEDVANAVAFLCSPLAGHINGANLVIDGGQSRAL